MKDLEAITQNIGWLGATMSFAYCSAPLASIQEVNIHLASIQIVIILGLDKICWQRGFGEGQQEVSCCCQSSIVKQLRLLLLVYTCHDQNYEYLSS